MPKTVAKLVVEVMKNHCITLTYMDVYDMLNVLQMHTNDGVVRVYYVTLKGFSNKFNTYRIKSTFDGFKKWASQRVEEDSHSYNVIACNRYSYIPAVIRAADA